MNAKRTVYILQLQTSMAKEGAAGKKSFVYFFSQAIENILGFLEVKTTILRYSRW